MSYGISGLYKGSIFCFLLFAGSFDLGSLNELTFAQRNSLLLVMEALIRVMETERPSAQEVNTLMILTRNLLREVPEQDLASSLRQFGFDTDSIPFGFDLDTIKDVALPQSGDIIINENGQDKIVTGFGKLLFFNYHSKKC